MFFFALCSSCRNKEGHLHPHEPGLQQKELLYGQVDEFVLCKNKWNFSTEHRYWFGGCHITVGYGWLNSINDFNTKTLQKQLEEHVTGVYMRIRLNQQLTNSGLILLRYCQLFLYRYCLWLSKKHFPFHDFFMLIFSLYNALKKAVSVPVVLRFVSVNGQGESKGQRSLTVGCITYCCGIHAVLWNWEEQHTALSSIHKPCTRSTHGTLKG